jgi:hypothetical protein
MAERQARVKVVVASFHSAFGCTRSRLPRPGFARSHTVVILEVRGERALVGKAHGLRHLGDGHVTRQQQAAIFFDAAL